MFKDLRRLQGALAVVALLGLAGCGEADTARRISSDTSTTSAAPAEESALNTLYEQAKAEGGGVVVWAGGDTPNQEDGTKAAFEKRFPGIPVTMKVDLSKVHDVRIDEQLRSGNLEPDVALLQTTQDFERWRDQGRLLAFKPPGFEQFYPGYGDPDGAFIPAYMLTFLPVVNKAAVPEAQTPTGYSAFLEPRYKDKLVLTYPQDDDAVLYVYKKIKDKHGAAYMTKLAAQNPRFLRGTAAPDVLAGRAPYLGNLTGYPTAPDAATRSFVPAEDPFLVWTQRGAVFKEAKHPAAGRLYLAYLASKEFQQNWQGWKTRKDVPPSQGLQPLANYRNTDPLDFAAFMRDRNTIEKLKKEMDSYFGPVQGPSPLTDPKLLPLYGIN